MILAPLKYLAYKINSSKVFNKKIGYYNSLLAAETLINLKQRIRQPAFLEKKVDVDLSTQHLNIGENINHVFKHYGCPTYFKSNKLGGVIHDVVMYKRIINGQKSKVIYNFINGTTASIGFNITISNKHESEKVTSFIKETYFKQIDTDFNTSLSGVDNNGNRLLVENTFDITLTYINYNPEIIQNINAAIYKDKYNQEKYVDSEKFQLTS